MILDYWKEKKMVEKLAKAFADSDLTNSAINERLRTLLAPYELVKPILITTLMNFECALLKAAK